MIRIHTVILAVLVICTGAPAQESEIEAARHRIQDLLAEAERIEHEAAERVQDLRREAERIEERLRGAERRPNQSPDQRTDRARTEREVALEQLEVMRIALHAFREAGRRDAAEMLEHAIHARELALEGRRGDEAMHVRETAPGRAEQAELLEDAARLWHEFGSEERARAVARLAEQMRRRDRPRDVERDRPARTDREHVMHELEIMRLAMPALREGERRDALDLLERAMHARELALEGRAEAAEHARREAPSTGQQAEILGLASRLWAEFGHEEKATAVGRLAEELAGRARAGRIEHHDQDERSERIEHLAHRLEEMTHAMQRIQAAMEEMHAELSRLRR